MHDNAYYFGTTVLLLLSSLPSCPGNGKKSVAVTSIRFDLPTKDMH